MHKYISSTAKYGDLTRGPRVVNRDTKKEMKKILTEIQTGKFARQWIKENKQGLKNYNRLMKADMNHKIEKVGAKLRERMPWLQDERA
jgi:ketol-acid reductoisomerase